MAAPARATSTALGDAPTALALTRLASDRDAEAWRHLVERHGAAMHRAALRVTRDRHLAADACQEAFLLVRDAARRFVPLGDDVEAAARGWLLRVATTSALMALRRARRRERLERELPELVTAEEPPSRTDRLADALEAEVARLPSWQREPLLLHIYGDIDYETIAATLGITPVTARTRVHRALTRLRRRLGERGVLAALATIPAVPSFQAPPFAAAAQWIGLLRSTARAGIPPPASVVAGPLANAALVVAVVMASAAAVAPLVRPRPAPAPVPAASTSATRPGHLSLPANAWVRRRPTSRGPGALQPIGWSNAGVYDAASRRVIVLEHWTVPDDPSGSSMNALVAYDPVADELAALAVHDESAVGSSPLVLQPEGCLALVPDRRRVYIASGADRYQTTPPPPTCPRAFDLATGAWSRAAPDDSSSPTWHSDRGSPGVMTYDARNRVVVLLQQKDTAHAGTQTWLLDPDTGIWTRVPQDPTARTVDVSASGIAYDAKRGLVLTFGGGFQFDGSSRRLHAYSVAKNRWRELAPCPSAANAPGFAYDSTHDVFLAVVGEETWIYDPGADAWSRSADLERGARRVFQSVTYDPDEDVFVFAGGDWSDPRWALFRFSPSP